jgi:hypothetical protein
MVDLGATKHLLEGLTDFNAVLENSRLTYELARIVQVPRVEQYCLGFADQLFHQLVPGLPVEGTFPTQSGGSISI